MKAILLFGLSYASFASAQVLSPPTPHYYRCQNECYAMGSDGTTLFYSGGETDYSSLSKSDAFRKSKRACPFPNLLVHRNLKGITTAPETTPVTESNFSVHQGWNHSSSHQYTRTYTFTEMKTRAQFTAEEANETNACTEIKEDEMPDFSEFYGDMAFG